MPYPPLISRQGGRSLWRVELTANVERMHRYFGGALACVVMVYDALLAHVLNQMIMRSKKKIEQKYNELRLRNKALNNKMDELDCIKDHIDYDQIAAEQEAVQEKELILAWVLGYSKTL